VGVAVTGISGSPNVVYENITKPRYDDMVFNAFGQLIYKLTS
jgi:hypothetical protein